MSMDFVEKIREFWRVKIDRKSLFEREKTRIGENRGPEAKENKK
jgi:hypothetical protein